MTTGDIDGLAKMPAADVVVHGDGRGNAPQWTQPIVVWCWDSVTYQEWFYVNQGWGGYGNQWVAASTWFAGSVLS